MTVTINGTTGITNDGGYTGDGVVFADTTPANTLVTTTGGSVGIGTSSPTLNTNGTVLHINNSTASRAAIIHMTNAESGSTSADGLICGKWSDGTNYFFDYDSNPIVFGTGGGERARIDSSGNFMVGTTGDFGKFRVRTDNTSGGTWGCQMVNSVGTLMFGFLNNGNFYTGSGAGSPYNNTTGASANVVVSSDQGLLLRSTSSLRYKTDVQDAVHGLADLLSLRPVTYKGKNDGEKVFGGLIAEEVDEAGLNEFVVYDSEGRPDALHYGNMVSLCVKAIQEQQAIITALTARVAALEGK